MHIIMQNFVAIGQIVAETEQFVNFSKAWPSAILDFKNSKLAAVCHIGFLKIRNFDH